LATLLDYKLLQLFMDGTTVTNASRLTEGERMKKILVFAGAATLVAGMPSAAHAQSAQLANRMQIMTNLHGMNDVPRGDMHGSGTATITLYPKSSKVCYAVTIKGVMGYAFAAHIHKGPVGKEGPVVIPIGTPGKNGRTVGCVNAKTFMIRAIMQNPRQYYVNVHTKEYPGGAVRGQL